MGIGFNNTFTPYFAPIPFTGFGSAYRSSVPSETDAERKKRLKKEEAEKARAEFEKRLEEMRQKFEQEKQLRQQIADAKTIQKDLTKTINKAKKGKENAEGAIEVKESWNDYKKISPFKKGLRALSNLGQGVWKLAEGFVGYEVNEKTGKKEWNPKKCLKNAAIAAFCIAATAIPVVGPVISTGLLTTGVVCGAYGTYKGVKKAVNAKNPEELDNAFQDIGAGLAIGISSAAGLRGLGKGLQASAGTSGVVRSTGSNAVTQFAKDCTINAFRATKLGVNTGRSAVKTLGFRKAFINNLKDSIPKFGKTKFENTKNNTIESIETRLNTIDKELSANNITPFKKALLEQEKSVLNLQKTEIQNTVTRTDWKNLKDNSKLHNEVKDLKIKISEMKNNGSTEINGTSFSAEKENIKALKESVKSSKEIAKQISKLSKTRNATIKKMSFYKKHASEVEMYTGKTRTNRFGRIYDTMINKSDMSWKNVLTAPFKAILGYLNIPFSIWGYAGKSSASTFYKIQETVIPTYESGMLDDLLGFGKKVITTKVVTQNEKGENIEQEVAVTKDILTKLEEQKKQYDEAIAAAQSELVKMYTA